MGLRGGLARRLLSPPFSFPLFRQQTYLSRQHAYEGRVSVQGRRAPELDSVRLRRFLEEHVYVVEGRDVVCGETGWHDDYGFLAEVHVETLYDKDMLFK